MASKGLDITDKVSVMILKKTIVEGRSYIPPFDFKRLTSEDKKSHWTLAKDDKFLNQTVNIPIEKESELEKKFGYDNVFTITNVIDNDFGAFHMRHFKVIGK